MISNDSNYCESCSDLMFGCTRCSNQTVCTECDASLNLTTNPGSHCKCQVNKTCLICGPYQIINKTKNYC